MLYFYVIIVYLATEVSVASLTHLNRFYSAFAQTRILIGIARLLQKERFICV
jgi:hypothetical protein